MSDFTNGPTTIAMLSQPIGEQAPRVSPGSASRLSDHTASFVRNEWYVVPMSDEMDRTLRDRWLLGAIVLPCRTTDGTTTTFEEDVEALESIEELWRREDGIA